MSREMSLFELKKALSDKEREVSFEGHSLSFLESTVFSRSGFQVNFLR